MSQSQRPTNLFVSQNQLLSQRIAVEMCISKSFGFAESNAVNNAGMIQLIADHCV